MSFYLGRIEVRDIYRDQNFSELLPLTVLAQVPDDSKCRWLFPIAEHFIMGWKYKCAQQNVLITLKIRWPTSEWPYSPQQTGYETFDSNQFLRVRHTEREEKNYKAAG